MLSINFEDFRRRFPHLEGAFNDLERFLGDRPDLKHIDPLRVLNVYPELDPALLGFALSVLADEGVVEQAYAVMAPNRALARGKPFKSPSEVPLFLRDSFDDPFPRAEGKLVPIFVGAVGGRD